MRDRPPGVLSRDPAEDVDITRPRPPALGSTRWSGEREQAVHDELHVGLSLRGDSVPPELSVQVNDSQEPAFRPVGAGSVIKPERAGYPVVDNEWGGVIVRDEGIECLGGSGFS